jgi:hypothetical protein
VKVKLLPTLIGCMLAASGSSIYAFSIDGSANKADWNPAAPWKLPAGVTQRVVSSEANLNIYGDGYDDWNDMNTLNETGLDAGRYMYRTHEVRMGDGSPSSVNSVGGSVSVVDLTTGEAKILANIGGYNTTGYGGYGGYNSLDGILWTPWGTLLFAEENEGGRLFEAVLDPNDPTKTLSVNDRPAVGRMSHEGIEVDDAGNLYVIDEHRGRTDGCTIDGVTVKPCGGGIYKFVPTNPNDLSSGNLYALAVSGADGVGKGSWVGPIDPENVQASGTQAGGQSYQRPEDLEIINNVLYAAITEGPRDTATTDGTLGFKSELYEGRVISIDLSTMEVKNFIKPGVNVAVEIGKPGEVGHQSGFDSVDNLAKIGDVLVMIEDNVPSDIWYASASDVNSFGAANNVTLFASLTDPGAEGTGIYYHPSQPTTLFVNVQHSDADDGDATWAFDFQ